MIRKTSLDAYKYIQGEGILGNQQRLIKNHLEAYPGGLTLKEICRGMGIEINAVAGRVNELKDSGWLIECEKRKCTVSRRTVTPVRRTTKRDKADLGPLFG